MTPELSAATARRLFLGAQGLLGAQNRRAGVRGVITSLGAIQLDTISVLARTHELVPYARLGPVGRAAVEDAYWGPSAHAFEYWAHAACILPIEYWPYFSFRRRRYSEWYARRRPDLERMKREVLARVAAGPLTATELGGAKKGGPWWDWSDAKRAVEALLGEGKVVCVKRRGWKRVYDLPERAIPRHLLDADLSDRDCLVKLVEAAGARLGVATAKDIADYFRMRLDDVTSVLDDAGLVAVTVRGWRDRAWGDPRLLDHLRAGRVRARHRTVLLSPFDSLVWDRARTERVFGFSHRLEAYVPKPKRIHGYFAMPLLASGRLVGRVDPARSGHTLVARTVSVQSRYVDALAVALNEAARWVGLSAVALERVDPPEVTGRLRAELDRIA
jgi:uncharacterized protein